MNWLHFLFTAECYVMLALATNLLAGYAGQMSFASASFYGIGAYGTSLAMMHLGLPFTAALILAMAAAAALSLPLAFLATRTKGLSYVLGSIAFQVVVFRVFYNWYGLTGGSNGLNVPVQLSFFGWDVDDILSFCLLGGLFAAAFLAFFAWFRKTPFARLLTALRADELGSQTLGKNIPALKYSVHLLSAALLAVPGGFYALYADYLSPDAFNLDESILILSAVLIGGMGKGLLGPVAGAFFYVFLPEMVRQLPLGSHMQGATVQMLIYSLLLVLVVRFRPNGFFGENYSKH